MLILLIDLILLKDSKDSNELRGKYSGEKKPQDESAGHCIQSKRMWAEMMCHLVSTWLFSKTAMAASFLMIYQENLVLFIFKLSYLFGMYLL